MSASDTFRDRSYSPVTDNTNQSVAEHESRSRDITTLFKVITRLDDDLGYFKLSVVGRVEKKVQF